MALNGADVNENDDYKRDVKTEDVQTAGKALAERRESNPTPLDTWPPTLKNDYVEELPRLNKKSQAV